MATLCQIYKKTERGRRKNLMQCNLNVSYFSPTLYVGEYEYGSFATGSYVDETTVTIAVSQELDSGYSIQYNTIHHITYRLKIP